MRTFEVSRVRSNTVQEVLCNRGLRPLFQPIVALQDGSIEGYEGLIRGPARSGIEMPHELFSQAALEGRSVELELLAARTCIDAFTGLQCKGKLFVNFSADALCRAADQGDPLAFMQGTILEANRIVIELTEKSVVSDVARFIEVIDVIRSRGACLALDDYGTENASMSLWLKLRPNLVKIDRFFVQGISDDPLKYSAVSAMLSFATESRTRLIAEGIESTRDLTVLRDLGIDCGQGYLIARPSARPSVEIADEASRVLAGPHISVSPERRRASPTGTPAGVLSEKMVVHAPSLPTCAKNDEVAQLFGELPYLHAVAIVENGKPVALLNRRVFTDQYARPFHRELFGKRSCLTFANVSPAIIDKSTSLDQILQFLSGDDHRYLADGFIITENGSYAGLGTGESLVRAVTERRIEVARYSNPLTFLPGNVPISAHIERLLDSEMIFTACYVDLNNFKPFNDQYGYWQGDRVLKFAASGLAGACDPTSDFLGHVGGDDFLILFRSPDWESRMRNAIRDFNRSAVSFYAAEDRDAGGISGEDRRGNPSFFCFVTMSAGCVVVDPERLNRRLHSEHIASVAAVAKRRAKASASGIEIFDADTSAANFNSLQATTT
ncbi:phosphodiesterase [Paraburkholderia sp. IMGN_8]|uniref:phosphodiesterase n=1 Tax=Paraburkholderia sp. IMGN_8 TaxID=3136564 RepID=UPI003100C6B8